ncbi:MAG: hypothetical protein ACE5KO_04725 [Candidatus Bathyarchaeia archaeon]
MPWSNWIAFLNINVETIPNDPGVYELAVAGETIYIGRSDDMRKRLADLLKSDDACIQNATVFRFYQTNSPKADEKLMLEEHKKTHNGKPPICNESLPK